MLGTRNSGYLPKKNSVIDDNQQQDSDNVARIQTMYVDGLITEEEYENLLAETEQDE